MRDEGRTHFALATSPSLRWSSVRDCARKAVYEATDAPARERTLAENRQLYRGRSVGHDWVIAVATEKMWKVWIDSGPTHWLPPELAATSEDEADVLAELRVQWEMGAGHADLYIRETDIVIEVLSSRDPTGDMIHSKLLQARGYARALDASNIALIVVDPSTLEEERVIVTAGTPRWDELAVECDERLAQVLAWRDTGQLPARVCGKPGEAWGHFCTFAAHCFDGWEPDVPDSIVSDEAQQLAIELAHVKAQRRSFASTDKTLEVEQKELQEQLADLVPAGEWQVGGYLVKRSDRSRSSFKLALAQQDSRIPGDILDEFTNVSTFSVWDVTKTGPAVVTADEQAPF